MAEAHERWLWISHGLLEISHGLLGYSVRHMTRSALYDLIAWDGAGAIPANIDIKAWDSLYPGHLLLLSKIQDDKKAMFSGDSTSEFFTILRDVTF